MVTDIRRVIRDSAAARVAPGIIVLLVGAVLARAIGGAVEHLDRLPLAVAIGAGLANVVGVPERLRSGIKTHMIWLGGGIVLMGASVSVEAIVAGGPTILILVVGVVAGTTVFVELMARNVFGLRERLGSLLAAGTGICGVSAVVAVARSINADEESIAYAAGTVLLFDAVTIIAYPAIGTLLSVPDRVFGVWAGLSMFSTGPIVAAGFAYSETAGQWATITKLARNALIGAVVLIYATYYARRDASANAGFRALWSEFPKFVLGFFLMAGIASLGLLSTSQVTVIEHAYNWLFLVAFVGLGTELRRDAFADSGLRPILVVSFALAVVGSVTLAGTWILLG
jgi:uncharacterized integral membrane protein (TIGR00698 family)